jgi:diketogulonate reductase-like aldo/keto reductase
MKILKDVYTLANGITIPKVGFGTWQIKNEDAYQATLDALAEGYRHIDTAQAYRNEEAIGQALKACNLGREEVFVTSKLPSHIKGYKQTLASFRRTMKDLQLDVLDLYLIHAPWPWDEMGKDCTEGNIESWKAMIELYNEGKIRSIGVSNFSISDLQALIQATNFTPHVNQIRYYVGDTQDELVAFCQANNILIEAYSPLATGRILEHPELNTLAKEKNVSVAQLCIRYCLDKGTLPLPKTTKRARMQENAALDFQLSADELKRLDALKNLDGRLK